MEKKLKYSLLNNLLTSIIFHLLEGDTKSLRVTFQGKEKIKAHLEKDGQIIVFSLRNNHRISNMEVCDFPCFHQLFFDQKF